MSQSSVPHTEISLRLAICSEFLLDEQKPIEEVYGSWMRRVGGRIMEYKEFEYWYRRFQNNQFDLGYDTSQDSKRISETQNTTNSGANEAKNGSEVIIEKKEPEKVVKRKMEDLKLDHQFNKENVPETFRILINGLGPKLGEIRVNFDELCCKIDIDNIPIHLSKGKNYWSYRYATNNTVNITCYPEKSIIDHLWFVLNNPNIRITYLNINCDKNRESMLDDHQSLELNFEKLNTLLQSMFDTFNHQIHTSQLNCSRLNEDTYLSMLKHVQPGTLEEISLDISWKDEGNYQKMKEIVETGQWKKAKLISAPGVTPFKIDDLLHCEKFWLELDRITPEDVLRITEHFFNATGTKECTLFARDESLDIDAIMNVLRSQNNGLKITGFFPNQEYFQFKIIKSTGCISLDGSETCITIRKNPQY